MDTLPPDNTCGNAVCAWGGIKYGCYNPSIYQNGLCQASCGTCPNLDPPLPTMALKFNITKTLVNGNRNYTCSVAVSDGSGWAGLVMMQALLHRGTTDGTMQLSCQACHQEALGLSHCCSFCSLGSLAQPQALLHRFSCKSQQTGRSDTQQ